MSIVPQLILNSVVIGSVYVLVALGFWMVYNAAKFFNLAHGLVGLAGAYFVYFVTTNFGLNMYPAIILGILFSGLLGLALEKFIFLPLRRNKASSLVQLVASLGALTVMQAILAMIFSTRFHTIANLIPNQKIYTLFGGTITQIQVITFIFAILCFSLVVLLLKKTKLGLSIMAINDDEEVAKIVGIDTNKIIGYVFFIGSCLAGLAGILYGLDTGLEPTIGLNFLLFPAMAAIIGGIKSIRGVLLGCFILALVENFGIWQISGEWRGAIAFSLLIIFLIFRPQGLIKE